MTVVGTMENTVSPTVVTCQKDLKSKSPTKKKGKKSDEDHSVETELINKTRKSRRGRPSQCTEFWLMFKEISKRNDPAPSESATSSTAIDVSIGRSSVSQSFPFVSKFQSPIQSSSRQSSVHSSISPYPSQSHTSTSRPKKPRPPTLSIPSSIPFLAVHPSPPHVSPSCLSFAYPLSIYPSSSCAPSTHPLRVHPRTHQSTLYSRPTCAMPNYLPATDLPTFHQSLTYPFPLKINYPSLNHPASIQSSLSNQMTTINPYLPIDHVISSSCLTIPSNFTNSASNSSSQFQPFSPLSQSNNFSLSRSNSLPEPPIRNAITPPQKRKFSESKDERSPASCKRPNSESNVTFESTAQLEEAPVNNPTLEFAKEVPSKDETSNRKQTPPQSLSTPESQRPYIFAEVQNLHVTLANPLDLSVASSNPRLVSHEKDYRNIHDLSLSSSCEAAVIADSFDTDNNKPSDYSNNIPPSNQLQNNAPTSFVHSKSFTLISDSLHIDITNTRNSSINKWDEHSKRESHPSTEAEGVQDLQTKCTTGNPSPPGRKGQIGLTTNEPASNPQRYSKADDDNQCLNLSNYIPVVKLTPNGSRDLSEALYLSNPKNNCGDKFENVSSLDSPEDLRVHALDLSTSKLPLDLRRH